MRSGGHDDLQGSNPCSRTSQRHVRHVFVFRAGGRPGENPGGLDCNAFEFWPRSCSRRRGSAGTMTSPMCSIRFISRHRRRKSPRWRQSRIDIAAMGFSTLPLAIENAGLKDLRLLADEVQDGNGSGFTLQFMVRRDFNINSVTDLKGKVLATIGIGTGAHTGMLANAAEVWRARQARLHRHRNAVSDHEGHAQGRQGRTRLP